MGGNAISSGETLVKITVQDIGPVKDRFIHKIIEISPPHTHLTGISTRFLYDYE